MVKKSVSKRTVKRRKSIKKGGDGYSVSLDDPIVHAPAINRYSEETTPVFPGPLTGGDGYSVNFSHPISGMPSYNRYSNNYRPIFDGPLLSDNASATMAGGGDCGCDAGMDSNSPLLMSGGGNCGCDANSTAQTADKSMFNLIKQGGGSAVVPSQFQAINMVSRELAPLGIGALCSVIILVFLHHFVAEKPRKAAQMGGYVQQLSETLMPLGKNNLITLAALMLLHHFAIAERYKKGLEVRAKGKTGSKSKSGKKTSKRGGAPDVRSTLSQILAPLGINALGAALLLVAIEEAFINSNKKSNGKSKSKQHGGASMLKDLIAPLGTNAFIATGLLVILQRVFENSMRQSKATTADAKKKIGGSLFASKKKLFHLLSPITFSSMNSESVYQRISANKNLQKILQTQKMI